MSSQIEFEMFVLVEEFKVMLQYLTIELVATLLDGVGMKCYVSKEIMDRYHQDSKEIKLVSHQLEKINHLSNHGRYNYLIFKLSIQQDGRTTGSVICRSRKNSYTKVWNITGQKPFDLFFPSIPDSIWIETCSSKAVLILNVFDEDPYEELRIQCVIVCEDTSQWMFSADWWNMSSGCITRISDNQKIIVYELDQLGKYKDESAYYIPLLDYSRIEKYGLTWDKMTMKQ